MDEIYVNVECVKPGNLRPPTSQTGPSSSDRKCYRAAVLCLGLLSVILLVGLISLGVRYRDLERSLSAELSVIEANLTERLQASNDKLSLAFKERDVLNGNLTALTKELARLQALSKQNRDLERSLSAELSIIEANLTERLQASNDKLSLVFKERDVLNGNLTALTKELARLQALSKQKKTCPAGWRMFSCTCYFFSTESNSWDKSREDCRDRGADLVIIDSLEEQEFLSNSIQRNSWIGLTDRDSEGTWKWIDETPLTLKYWPTEQPDNGGGHPQLGEEDCVHLTTDSPIKSNWNDLRCDHSLGWICEK